MITSDSIDSKVKASRSINESFDLAFRLLKSVYIRERPGDNLPYMATEAAKSLFNHPTGAFNHNLNNYEHTVWRRWYQTNNQKKTINLLALSNLFMHELWTLLMAVQEYNLGNIEVAEIFAGKAELGMREIESKWLLSNEK